MNVFDNNLKVCFIPNIPMISNVEKIIKVRRIANEIVVSRKIEPGVLYLRSNLSAISRHN